METKQGTDPLRRVAVIGCGRVGSAVAYTLMQTGWLSKLVLIDLDRQRARGEAADLRHALPFHTPMSILAGGYSDLTDCGLIVLTAGSPRPAGEDRGVRAQTNARIFRTVVNDIAIYNQTAVLLVVTNPVELLTQIALSASGFPPHRVMGTGTVLDTARLKQLMGQELGVDARQIHGFVIGEHGDRALAVWSSANVSGIPLLHYREHLTPADTPSSPEAVLQLVRASADELLSTKGYSCYAIAESVKRIIGAILGDENAILTVSTLASGVYGLENVCLSLPCTVNRCGIGEVLEIPLSPREREQLGEIAQALRREAGLLDRALHLPS